MIEGLREWVRIGILQRRFREVVQADPALKEETELLSRPPSLTSLAEAIKRLRLRVKETDRPVRIVHAEPPLETNHHSAAQELVKASFPQGAVVSFKNFLAQLPA